MSNKISVPPEDRNYDPAPQEGHSRSSNSFELSRVVPARTRTLREAMDEIARYDSHLDLDSDGVPESPLNRAQAAAANNTTEEQWQAHLKKWFPSGP